MIQRIQTVYLLMASLAIYALFLFPVANILNETVAQKIMVTGVYETLNNQVAQTQSFTLLTIATALLGFIPLMLIFLYKNRKQQAGLVYLVVVLCIGYSFWVSQTVKGASQSVMQISDYGIGAGLSSVAILFLVLAAKGILRDDKLVKSADRLR